MNKKEIIRKIIKDNNGILLSKNLSDNDISLQYISEMVKDGEIFKAIQVGEKVYIPNI